MTLITQQNDLKRLEAAIKAGRDKIASVDADLKEDARRERIATIRAEVAAQAQAIAAEMATRAKAAREGVEYWSQDGVRRRAKFAEDPAADAAQRQTLSAGSVFSRRAWPVL